MRAQRSHSEVRFEGGYRSHGLDPAGWETVTVDTSGQAQIAVVYVAGDGWMQLMAVLSVCALRNAVALRALHYGEQLGAHRCDPTAAEAKRRIAEARPGWIVMLRVPP